MLVVEKRPFFKGYNMSFTLRKIHFNSEHYESPVYYITIGYISFHDLLLDVESLKFDMLAGHGADIYHSNTKIGTLRELHNLRELLNCNFADISYRSFIERDKIISMNGKRETA